MSNNIIRIGDAVKAIACMDAMGTPICIETLATELNAYTKRDRKKVQDFITKLKFQHYLVPVGTVRYCHNASCSVYATPERVEAGLPDDYITRLEWHSEPRTKRPPISQDLIYAICCELTNEGVPITVMSVSARVDAYSNNVYKMLEKLRCHGRLERVGTIPRWHGSPANLYEVAEP